MVLIAAVVILFVIPAMKGESEGSTAPVQDQSAAGSGAPLPGGAPGSMPAPSGPGPAMAPTQTPAAAPAVNVPGAPGQQVAQANTTTGTASINPQPGELWRADPFAPDTFKKREGTPKQRLLIPIPGRIFYDIPQPTSTDKPWAPQPPRRVAGILFGDRVNALIQTQNGWETVRPGDKLADGTYVQQIERDRVILRTTDDPPRLVEVRLAASIVPVGAPVTPGSGSGSGAPPGLPRGRGPVSSGYPM